MQYRFFHIDAIGGEAQEEALNRFLGGNRVVEAHREFVDCGRRSFYSICVSVLEGASKPAGGVGGGNGKKRVDYKEILSPEEFAVFVRLREWRKGIAASDAVPVYTVFTNEQLAAMARQVPGTEADLSQIQGIGQARVKKYGATILDVLRGVDPDVPAEGV